MTADIVIIRITATVCWIAAIGFNQAEDYGRALAALAVTGLCLWLMETPGIGNWESMPGSEREVPNLGKTRSPRVVQSTPTELHRRAPLHGGCGRVLPVSEPGGGIEGAGIPSWRVAAGHAADVRERVYGGIQQGACEGADGTMNHMKGALLP